MTYNEKLNSALKFLHENQHGSFMYFLSLVDNPNKKQNFRDKNQEEDENTRLFPYLKRIGVHQKEFLPLINQLERDGYLDVFYKDENDNKFGILPHQIKITYSGMRFISETKGYKSLQPSFFSRHRDIFLIIIGALISAFFGIAMSYWQKSPEVPQIYIDTYQCDSTNVLEYKKNE